MVSENEIRAQIAGEPEGAVYPKFLKALVCVKQRSSDAISDKMALLFDMRMDGKLSDVEKSSITRNVQPNLHRVHSLYHYHHQQLSRHRP